MNRIVTRKAEVLAVGETRKAVVYQAPGFKERSCDSSACSLIRDYGLVYHTFCVPGTPLQDFKEKTVDSSGFSEEETLTSASLGPNADIQLEFAPFNFILN